MGRNKRNLVVALSLISVLTTGIANAQGNDARLKVNLKDADLLTATKMIAERTGVQFYFKSQKAFNRVTLQVENQTADDVIRFICDAAGAYVMKNDAGVYVISAEAPVTESVVAEGKTKARIFRKVKMLHAGADDIFNRVVLNRMLDPMAKQKELMRAIDLVKANNLSNGLSNSPAYNLYDQFVGTNQFTPKPQATTSTPTAGNEGNSIELPGEKSKQMGGMMGGPGMMMGACGPDGMPMGGVPYSLPGMVAGVTAPEYGMPYSGTPIGLPGPPHIPLGTPAGLQSHTIKNHTPMNIPGPVEHMKIHVRQTPGYSYPQPASRVRIHEQNINPGMSYGQPWARHTSQQVGSGVPASGAAYCPPGQ